MARTAGLGKPRRHRRAPYLGFVGVGSAFEEHKS
jgi:hypothetical protein